MSWSSFVSWSWFISWSWIVFGFTFISNISYVSVISIDRVGNSLYTTVGKLNVIATVGVVSISLFILTKVNVSVMTIFSFYSIGVIVSWVSLKYIILGLIKIFKKIKILKDTLDNLPAEFF